MIDIDAVRHDLAYGVLPDHSTVAALCDELESSRWLVRFKNVEIDDQRKTSERRLQLMARNWRERNAALAECEKLRSKNEWWTDQFAALRSIFYELTTYLNTKDNHDKSE